METIINSNCLDYMKSQEFQELTKKRKVVIITDPPFNIGYHYNSYKDKMNNEEYFEMLKQVFTMYDLPFVCIHYPEDLYRLAIYIYIYIHKRLSVGFTIQTQGNNIEILRSLR